MNNVCILLFLIYSKLLTNLHFYQIIGARGREVPIVIVANKSDEYEIERFVQRDVVEYTMRSWRNAHIECSAKENINIIQIFETILVQLNIQFDLHAVIHQLQRPNPHQANNCVESVLHFFLKLSSMYSSLRFQRSSEQ